MKDFSCGFIPIVVLLLVVAGKMAVAQPTTNERARSLAAAGDQKRPVVAVPIEVRGAAIKRVPAKYLARLTGRALPEAEAEEIEVFELRIAAKAVDLSALPPSRQLQLFIGRESYPVQRVEYSNWDLEKEKPLESGKPVADIHFYFFMIPAWRQIESGQAMVLTVLPRRKYLELTDNEPALNTLIRVLPELGQQVPLFEPSKFLDMTP